MSLAILTLYRIAFAPLLKSYQLALLRFTHKSGCGGAISVKERSAAAANSKVERHVSAGFVTPYFGAV